MPYADRPCSRCGKPFRPRSPRPTCWPCEALIRYGSKESAPAEPLEPGIDLDLKQYATAVEWDSLKAFIAHGSFEAAGAALGGVSPEEVRQDVEAIQRKAALRGYAPESDLTHPLPAGLTVSGTSARYNSAGEVDQFWNKSKPEGREPADVVKLADPKVISKVSTLTDASGKVTQQWVSEKPGAVAQAAAWQAAAEAFAESLPRVEPIALVGQPVRDLDLLSCYPVGDHHLGMLSWSVETGENWDMKIAEAALKKATDHLVRTAPASEQGLVVFLGDLMHYDGFQAVTPTSRHLLDADGRFPKMVRATIRSMRYLIETAAAKHEKVHVIVEIGNHDLSSSVFLMECLANIYEREPRITIDTSPRHYHYFQFGKTLIGTHHGHGAKMDRLPSIMAADMPREWGETEHRYWWTGHIHHHSAKDFEKVSVESFRVLPPADAYAHQKGYRSKRDMKAIVIHREFGEVARHTVTPEMFGLGPDVLAA